MVKFVKLLYTTFCTIPLATKKLNEYDPIDYDYLKYAILCGIKA